MSLRDPNEVPNGLRVSLREETVPRLVQLLMDANRREQRANDVLEALNRKYHELWQENIALNHRDYCKMCQKKIDTTPKGNTYELCSRCSPSRQTIQSLKRELVKKEEELGCWQDCYETALSQFPDTTLSQS